MSSKDSPVDLADGADAGQGHGRRDLMAGLTSRGDKCWMRPGVRLGTIFNGDEAR